MKLYKIEFFSVLNKKRGRKKMKKAKKTLALLFAMVLCIGMMTMNVSAASTEQDGLQVSLTTDKSEYSQGDPITATLAVTNTNDVAVSNVSMENMIPEGYSLAEGSEADKLVESLDAGETVTMSVTYIADASTGEDNTEDTGKPSGGNINNDGSDSGTGNADKKGNGTTDSNDGSNNNSAGKGNSKSTGTNVKTGDNTNVALWVTIAVIAGAVIIVALVVKKKKSGKGLLSLFLCFAMTGTLFSGTAISTKAAEIQSKSITVSESVTINNETLQLSSTVIYDFDADDGSEDQGNDDVPADVGEISFREPTDEHIVFDESTGNYYVDNEILVTGKEGASRADIEQLINNVGGTIVGCIEITNDYQVEFSTIYNAIELKEIVDQLNVNDLIENATIHYLYENSSDATPNDSKWKSEEWSSDYPEGINWGVEAINAMDAWEHYDEMSYIKVGVIDTMFDTGHEDLVFTKVWNNPNNLSSETEQPEHGTHVAGTIAACYNNSIGIAGVAPKVTLYGYSMLGSDTDDIVTDTNKTFAGEMEWKYALANLICANCKVINVSMGLGTPSASVSTSQGEIIGAFLQKLLNKGYDFVIVQSAGNAKKNDATNLYETTDASNNGIFTGITTPDVRNRIIIVGNIGTNGSHKNGLFGWFGERVFDGYYFSASSNYGDRVDVVAPGESIYSTLPDDDYGLMSGTSMAAPHVSGIAAMCYSVNPALTGAQVKSIITNTTDTTVRDNNSTDTSTYSAHDELLTYDLVNASDAVETALNTDGEAVSPVNPSNGIVMGNVRGYDDNHQASIISDVSISAYRITDYDGNLSEYASSTRSDADGNYELILETGTYYINIYKEGYLPFAICDVTVTNDQITYLDNVILIADSGAEVSNIITGTVRNALTGASIDGVTVRLRPGWGNQSGTLATLAGTNNDAVTVTDANGQYSLEVNEGCYTAEVIKEGYITGYVNVICTNMNDTNQDAVLTPVLSDNEYRIVLTWSSTPRDLDSHISGPLSTGGRFHVYYSDMSASDNGETVASLDLDDTSSYGPETITLTKTQNGVYKYAVQDYSNRNSSSSTALSMSGAKVELYCGNSLVGTYTVPINKTGTVWNVFEIEGDEIRTINTMENISSPSSVCALSSSDTDIAVNALSIEPEKENDSDTSTEQDASLPDDIQY